MSKAAKQRRFLRWKKYRRQCTKSTRQHVPFTFGMSAAWIRAVYRVKEGKFYAMPPWHNDRRVPYGKWEWRGMDTAEDGT
jgi:hypothetical protein